MFGHGGHHHGHGHHQPPPPHGGAYPPAPGGPQPKREPTFRIFCRADESYCITVRGDAVVLAPSNPRDEYQHWYKDMRYSTRVKDKDGFPAFALVNKATGLAIKHSLGQSHPVRLIPYNPDYLDESVLWTESGDVGKGFRCIRMVNNVELNFDAFHGDKDHGGVHDGTTIVLWKWCKGPNQSWKIVPHGEEPFPAVYAPDYGYQGSSGSQGAYPPRPAPGYDAGYRAPPGAYDAYPPPPAPGYDAGNRAPPGAYDAYPPPPPVNAQGYDAGYAGHRGPPSQTTVRIFCRANDGYNLTIRNGTVCLAPSNPRDDFQVKHHKFFATRVVR